MLAEGIGADRVGAGVAEAIPLPDASVDGVTVGDAFLRADGGWTALREIRVTTSQPARPERIVDHIGSMSWTAAMPGVERVQALSRMPAIIDAGDTPAELPIHVVIGLSEVA